MLKSLLARFRDPARDQPKLVIPDEVSVTEEYRLPAEAVEEYWLLNDAYAAAPSDCDRHAYWKLWAHLARNIPAVAEHPTDNWVIDDSEVLVISVKRTRKVPVVKGQL